MINEIGNVDWWNFELCDACEEFCKDVYPKRPIKNNFGGMGLTHSFYTWFLAKRLNPEYIIESGVWYGHSTWLLEEACPDAVLISLDPVDNRQYKSRKAIYSQADFTRINWDNVNKEKALVFFDDHYGVDRIFQAKERGFKHILYEDNYHDCRGNTSHPSGACCSPKACLAHNSPEGVALRTLLEIYYEFPPLYPNLTNERSWEWAGVGSREEYDRLNKPAVYETDEQLPEGVKADAPNYTWIAYLKVK